MRKKKLTEFCHVTFLRSIVFIYYVFGPREEHFIIHWFKAHHPRKTHTDIISGGSDIDCSSISRESLFISDCPACFPPTIWALLCLLLQWITSLKYHCPSYAALIGVNPKSTSQNYAYFSVKADLCTAHLYRNQLHAGWEASSGWMWSASRQLTIEAVDNCLVLFFIH